MKHNCKEPDFYIEEYEEYEGDPDAEFIIMCHNCEWVDDKVFTSYHTAFIRMEDNPQPKTNRFTSER